MPLNKRVSCVFPPTEKKNSRFLFFLKHVLRVQVACCFTSRAWDDEPSAAGGVECRLQAHFDLVE